jgi:hypothetical protein
MARTAGTMLPISVMTRARRIAPVNVAASAGLLAGEHALHVAAAGIRDGSAKADTHDGEDHRADDDHPDDVASDSLMRATN